MKPYTPPVYCNARWRRADIVAAWNRLESDYNSGGWLHERPSNQRRREACSVQIWRMGYRNAEALPMTRNAWKIYRNAEARLLGHIRYGRMPVRDDVETIEYHRPPTASEIRFGHGATHYATFTLEECCFPGTRIPKKWFVWPWTGLRYFR